MSQYFFLHLKLKLLVNCNILTNILLKILNKIRIFYLHFNFFNYYQIVKEPLKQTPM
jgi:hypothetical protein